MSTALDFELLVGAPDGASVPVRVLDSPGGEGAATMRFPYDTLELDSRLKDLQLALVSGGARRRRIVPEHERAVQSFGSTLFEALFTGEIRSLLDRSREEAHRQGRSLRIQLRFESADMASLPWEFLFDPAHGEYVCLSSSTPIVRYVELAAPQQPLTIRPPLRLLAMAASPKDLPQLDVAQERARITTALAPLVAAGRVELRWLEGQTWRDLQTVLLQGPWHAFHFVGHGGFDEARREGVIALADEEGSTYRLCATDLGRLLGDHRPLRLAVLNACEGGRADRLDVFSSTASVLVRRGTPAVVAMQYEITDVAAVELSRTFYSALAEGLPVDVALGEARKAVAVSIPGTLEWGTPVLYLRAPDSRIFDIDPAAVPPLRPPPPPPPPPPPATPPSARQGPVPWYRRRPVVAAGAGAAILVVLLLVGLLVLAEDDDTKGTGTFDLELAGNRFFLRHPVTVPKHSVLLIEVRPEDDLDVDVGAATRLEGARRLEDYLGDAGFDLDEFDDAFVDHEDDVRVPGRVIARIDEGDAGERERLVVTAPEGGRFTVVVVAAVGTRGTFVLEVERHRVKAPRRGEDYVEALTGTRLVERFLSDAALEDLEEFGGINVVPHLEEIEEEEIEEEDVVDEAEEPIPG